MYSKNVPAPGDVKRWHRNVRVDFSMKLTASHLAIAQSVYRALASLSGTSRYTSLNLIISGETWTFGQVGQTVQNQSDRSCKNLASSRSGTGYIH